MDPLTGRVVQRHVRASLEHDFEQRIKALLSYAPNNPPPNEIRDFRAWLANNFHFQTRTTPKGLKREKEELDRFYRVLALGEESGVMPGAMIHTIEEMWRQMKPYVPTWVAAFSSSEGSAKPITREVKEGGNTYLNEVGANDKNLAEMVKTIEHVFANLKGWRKQALSGGITVVFKGPKDFRGTSSGTYKRQLDQLWIRATTGGRVERGGSGYGGLAYVITHELGHRYENKHHVSVDFDRPEWHTSRYSHNDGESFAELFALSNFGITNQGDPAVLDRFEKLMGS